MKDKVVRMEDGSKATEKALTFRILKRCLLEGCVFGYPKFMEKPKAECIYCGAPRQTFDEWRSDPRTTPILVEMPSAKGDTPRRSSRVTSPPLRRGNKS